MPRQDSYLYGAQVIREVLPDIKSAGILFNTAEINSQSTASKMIKALENEGIEVLEGLVTGEEDVEKVARSLVHGDDEEETVITPDI